MHICIELYYLFYLDYIILLSITLEISNIETIITE